MQVLKTSKTKLGTDHPDTLNSMYNLAFTWKKQDRGAEAVALMKRCVQLRRQVLKTDDPSFVSSITALEQWEAKSSRIDVNDGLAEALLTEGHKNK